MVLAQQHSLLVALPPQLRDLDTAAHVLVLKMSARFLARKFLIVVIIVDALVVDYAPALCFLICLSLPVLEVHHLLPAVAAVSLLGPYLSTIVSHYVLIFQN